MEHRGTVLTRDHKHVRLNNRSTQSKAHTAYLYVKKHTHTDDGLQYSIGSPLPRQDARTACRLVPRTRVGAGRRGCEPSTGNRVGRPRLGMHLQQKIARQDSSRPRPSTLVYPERESRSALYSPSPRTRREHIENRSVSGATIRGERQGSIPPLSPAERGRQKSHRDEQDSMVHCGESTRG